MTLTLLLDLDDTLLHNKIEDFLPAYFRLLSEHLAPLVDPARLIDCLFHASRQMIANDRPDLSLQAVFEAHFYPGLGLDRQQFLPYEDLFYTEVFPRLKSRTRPLPAAQNLVAQASSLDARLAVATNPLFPRTAILQRLDWAELGTGYDSFDLVSSMETFHFAKPRPEFWAEVLAQMGWPQGPVIAVGDDYQNDVAAAQVLGLPAFWINREAKRPGQTANPPVGVGNLAELLAWVEEQGTEALTPKYDSPESAAAILAATVAALQRISEATHETGWLARPADNEWNLTEIVCHLRDVEVEVNLPRLKKVLDEEDPFLIAEDTDLWAEARGYARQDGAQAMAAFTEARLESLRLLRSLRLEDWMRRARHSIFGPTDLLEIVQIIAGHDRLHLRQIHELP